MHAVMIETRHLNSPRELNVTLVHSFNMDLQIALPVEAPVAVSAAAVKGAIMFLWRAMNFLHMSADSFDMAVTGPAIMIRVRR